MIDALLGAFREPVSLEGSIEALAALFSGQLDVEPDGQIRFKRERVDTQGNLAFWIYADDHAPPHPTFM